MNPCSVCIGNYFSFGGHIRYLDFPDMVRYIYCVMYNTKIEIEPIPLTDEWLRKLGFKPSEIEDQDGPLVVWGKLEGNHIWLEKYPYNPYPYYISDGFLEIKYVHQLQNLYFALTGEELEING